MAQLDVEGVAKQVAHAINAKVANTCDVLAARLWLAARKRTESDPDIVGVSPDQASMVIGGEGFFVAQRVTVAGVTVNLKMLVRVHVADIHITSV